MRPVFNNLLISVWTGCVILNYVQSYPDRCTRNRIGLDDESNSLQNTQILSPCVAPIEVQLDGRFRNGLSDGLYETTSAPWLNSTLATIGQKFAAKNWFGINVGMIIAQLVVSAIPDISRAFWPTGVVDDVRKSIRHYTVNILQHSVWYKEDMFGPKSNIFESMNNVRSMHLANIHKRSPKWIGENAIAETYKIDTGIWGGFNSDLQNSNIPLSRRVIPPRGGNYTKYYLNQFAMAASLWGMSAMPIIRSEQFGIPIGSDEELEGFLHFWAFLGHGVGIEDQFNVCLQPNLKEARIYYERFLNELLVPYLFHTQYESKVMVEVAARGFTETIGPIAQFDFILKRMLEDVVGIPATNLNAKMSPIGRTLDLPYRRLTKPAILISRTARRLINLIYEGYIQNLSKNVFGFDGTNKTIVAENAFNWSHN